MAENKERKRDPRLRKNVTKITNPFGYIEPIKKGPVTPRQYNVNKLEKARPYWEMIKKALSSNPKRDRYGNTTNKVANYIAANWPVDIRNYRRHIRIALKKALENDKVELVGASGRLYRLKKNPAKISKTNSETKKRKSVTEDSKKDQTKNKRTKTTLSRTSRISKKVVVSKRAPTESQLKSGEMKWV